MLYRQTYNDMKMDVAALGFAVHMGKDSVLSDGMKVRKARCCDHKSDFAIEVER